MVSAINTALSGLTAASTRLQVAANNIANINSTQTQAADGTVTNTPFQPNLVAQTSLSTGGVQAKVLPTTDKPQQVFQPDNPAANAQGLVAYPNVDLATQLVQTQLATYDYKANLKTVSVHSGLFKNLLDMIS